MLKVVLKMSWPDILGPCQQGIWVSWWQPCLTLGLQSSLPLEPSWLLVGGTAPTGAPL
jgi:hypothetical protein